MKKTNQFMMVTLLSTSVLAVATSASAQDSEPVDEIVVTGIRSALQNALIEKRQSGSLVEVILAEDIGKLPDQNLAEVLENITGIQITREAGVGTGVQIRGADENRVEINGVTTVGSGSGRNGIDFEDVASAIIAGVEVIKAPESSTIEGAVGGTINLRTIRPLDLKEGDTLANLRVQFEDSSLSTDGLQPRLDGTFGKKWSNAKGQEIGFVASLSYNEQDTTAFRPRADADNDNVVDANSATPGTTDFNFLPPQFFVQDLDNFEAETINFAGSLEVRPAQNVKLYFDAIVNDQERRQESSRIQASGISNSEVGLNVSNFTEFDTVDFGSLNGQEIGTIERAVVGIVPVQADGTDGNLRFSSDTGSRLTTSQIYR
ncbi:MAG: TonB-dependent receptor plug domain-containing protein, partial [Litorimonas sp.]